MRVGRRLLLRAEPGLLNHTKDTGMTALMGSMSEELERAVKEKKEADARAKLSSIVLMPQTDALVGALDDAEERKQQRNAANSKKNYTNKCSIAMQQTKTK